ncbi:hypothetical protein F4810DRAFT_648361 [Camillea tinctor]|nr:hypothetical protein F4810DRAFT_648361 [Camillea tinctor]
MATKNPRLGEPADAQSPKKRKLTHPLFPPPQFWDNLSQPVLTKNALRELDRRNSVKDKHRSRAHTTSRRYYTRNASIGVRKIPPPTVEQVLLTDQEGLNHFSRQGGPNLSRLRGHPPPSSDEMGSNRSSLGRRKRASCSTPKSSESPESSKTPKTTATTKSTGLYDRNFLQHLVDHHIYPPSYEYPNGDELPEPENLDDIRGMLKQPRRSLSPSRFSQDDFKSFSRACAKVTKESRMTATVIPVIEGDVGDERCIGSGIPFSNLDHLTDGSLVCAKPYLYYGARPEQLKKEIRKELGNLIAPSAQDDLPILPNNFLEVKGPDGTLSVARRQATYAAALGSRALHALQTYGADRSYDNKAYTLAWVYLGGTLTAYSSHPIPPSTPGGTQAGYVMTLLDGWFLAGNVDGFRGGVAAYRNGRDWAKLQRNRAIEQANKVVPRSVTTHPQHADSEDTSDTSEDELSLEYSRPAKRPRPPGDVTVGFLS